MDKLLFSRTRKQLLLANAVLLLVFIVLLRSPGRPLSLLGNTKPAEDAELNVGEEVRHTANGTTYGQTKRPNIIFMMADDLGYGDVHYNGGNADTPNLDAMAAAPNSIHLTRYYAAAPVCSPTRGSVLTGRNPNRYCIWKPSSDYPLPASEITIGDILREQGYHTAVYGKWHVGALWGKKEGISDPGMFGFDQWWVTPSSAPTLQTNCAYFDRSRAHCPAGHYGTPPEMFPNYYTRDSNMSQLKAWPDLIPGDDSQFMFERLSEFLESASRKNKPFFVYFPFHAVHLPFLATAKYQELYLARNYTLEEADYYGAISAMDEVVGRVQELLYNYNIYKNTMLWFTSDNGPDERFPGETAGLKGWKHTLWEGGIRVPGIIQWPAVIKENRQSDYPVVSSDLLPTVCDILGVDPPTDRPIDGISVLPFIRGDVTERHKSIAWEYAVDEGNFNCGHKCALLRGRYKLFASYNDGKLINAQLYDVVNDKSETTDISAHNVELFWSMEAELEGWRKSVIRSATQVVKCV